METNVYRPEASSFALKRDAIKARRARSALVVVSRSSWSFRNWTLSKATLLPGSDGASVGAEQTPTEGSEDEERSKAPCGERDANRREQGFARKARLPSASAATSHALRLPNHSSFHPFRRLASHIAEASGCRACPVGWAIAV